MSDAALSEFEKARTEQLDRNEARRMRTLINQARGDTHGAGSRWPFELTQNAHDPGARFGRTTVEVILSFTGKVVTYEHDGKPFTMQELAALLSGGSSKDFESPETTGRFGTGFLVTHVLSPDISFQGLVSTASGTEEVSIHLERGGDDDQIFANTTKCYEAIKCAKKVGAIDGLRTARFTYETDNPDAARIGLAAFRRALPYLYGTCEHLGSVHIQSENGESWQFEPEPRITSEFEGVDIHSRRFTIMGPDNVPQVFSAVRAERSNGISGSVVAITKDTGDGPLFEAPVDGFPRIFCRFPVGGSDFLPISAVIDGRFDLRQERDRVLMKERDKEQIAEALDLFPVLIKFALKHRWREGHKLAMVDMPERAFGDRLDEQPELQAWWKQNLCRLAEKLAVMPLVETPTGFLKAVGATPIATFVVPRFALSEEKVEFDLEDIWRVAHDLSDIHLPIINIAPDWSSIAESWRTLGVGLTRLALTEIADFVRPASKKLTDLKVGTEPLTWLTRFFDLVGRVAAQHNCKLMLTDLVPNQNGDLRGPGSLRRDAGIANELKDIACGLNHDVRERLVHHDLMSHYVNGQLSGLTSLLDGLIGESLGEEAVVRECMEELNRQLPDNKGIPSEKAKFRQGSVSLLAWLWQTRGKDAAQLAQQCPLIASDDSAVRWTVQRKAMAPVSVWHPSARPFSMLYENDRILAEDYANKSGLVDALVQWDLAFSDPLCTDTPRELRDERLRAIAIPGVDCVDATVVGVALSQIALLPTQLIQRCQIDEALAKALLGLTLQHVAVHDSSWRQGREVVARRNRNETSIRVFPALWLADLKSKAWVPVRSEKDGQHVIQPVVADAGNLRSLLDPSWLVGNDAAVDLLTQFFGFKSLELRLLSTVQSGTDRDRVENELARIVQVLGGDPTAYDRLAGELATKQQREAQREKNRRFGIAIQEAIASYLKARNLHPDFIDQGYDYDLFLDSCPIDAGTHHFRLGDYLLEVKATTTGEVRLTPAQAQTASEELERFILCVVDLRNVPNERLEQPWIGADVEPRARILVRIGSETAQSCGFVEQARACEVGIRNEAALRYGVPVAVWENGLALRAWVDSLPSAIGVAPTLSS